MSNWHALHYNAIAKEIRELFPSKPPTAIHDYETQIMNKKTEMEQRAILTTLAINLAKRFVEDNERFNPLRFLDACSPDTTFYPLSELWEDN